jgi:hypothetical protein
MQEDQQEMSDKGPSKREELQDQVYMHY